MVTRVQQEDFTPGFELDALTSRGRNIGGLCVFVGVVRELGERGQIESIFLDHYPRMTELQLSRVEAIARSRWSIDDVLIIHRYGRLFPCERIMMVATAARRRDPAFDSCRFIVNWLKTEAPFWKQEQTADGAYWLEA